MEKRTKSKKPPCRICRSKKWRKNNLGFYVCEFGHQLEGHQEEEGEFNENQGSTFQRKLRAKKRKRREVLPIFLSGANLEYLFIQSFQHILRLQVYTLIHDLGFPSEFEHVVHEYWTIYLLGIKRFHDSAHTTFNFRTTNRSEGEEGSENDSGMEPSDNDTELNVRGSENQSDQNIFKDKAMDEKRTTDAIDASNEYQSDGSESSSESDGERVDYDFNSERDEFDLEAEGGEGINKSRSSKSNNKGSREIMLTLPHTIVFCYLSAQHLKLPVVFGDFYKWIIQRKIPYFNAYDELPADMKRRLGYGYQTALLPSVNTIGSFHFVMKGLIIRFINVYKLELSMPNMPSLIFRFVQELALPIEVYPCALRLSRLLFETVDRKAKYKVHKESWVPIVTMACVVIVAKLIFGLDGKDRSAINHLSWTNSFPKESDWMRSLDVFGSVKSQSSIPGFFGEFEELIQVNPDIYSEYCKLAIRPIPEPVFRQVVGIVQSTEYAKETEDSSLNKDISLSIETFIKNLHSNVQPPERRSDMDSEEPPPLRPGEGYVHYKKDNVDVYLGRYERLLGYASNILYIKPKTLEFEISFIENRLFSVSS